MGKYLNFIIGLIFLSGCTISTKGNLEGNHIYESPLGYSMNVPKGFTYSELAPSKEFYYFGYPDASETNISVIEFHEVSPTKCSQSITGISNSSVLAPKIQWGYANIWDQSKLEGFDNFSLLDSAICKKWEKNEHALYVLCSESQKSTVVVCLDQKINNPEQAENIFKTFKWIQ
jgi:hypothetical protein